MFEVMLGRLMNAGLLSQARELAALFEHNSIDLVIVLVCRFPDDGILCITLLANTQQILSHTNATHTHTHNTHTQIYIFIYYIYTEICIYAHAHLNLAKLHKLSTLYYRTLHVYTLITVVVF